MLNSIIQLKRDRDETSFLWFFGCFFDVSAFGGTFRAAEIRAGHWQWELYVFWFINVVVLDACRDFPAAWSRSVNRGLTVVANQPADSIIVYATSAGSTAADGAGRNGLFTGELLKNLKTPGLDVKQVFDRTGADVARAATRRPTAAPNTRQLCAHTGRNLHNGQPRK